MQGRDAATQPGRGGGRGGIRRVPRPHHAAGLPPPSALRSKEPPRGATAGWPRIALCSRGRAGHRHTVAPWAGLRGQLSFLEKWRLPAVTCRTVCDGVTSVLCRAQLPPPCPLRCRRGLRPSRGCGCVPPWQGCFHAGTPMETPPPARPAGQHQVWAACRVWTCSRNGVAPWHGAGHREPQQPLHIYPIPAWRKKHLIVSNKLFSI